MPKQSLSVMIDATMAARIAELEAEAKQLRAKLQAWHDWERAYVFVDEGVPWPGTPGVADPVGVLAEVGEEVGRLRGACNNLLNHAMALHSPGASCRFCLGYAIEFDQIVHPNWCPVPAARAALEPAP